MPDSSSNQRFSHSQNTNASGHARKSQAHRDALSRKRYLENKVEKLQDQITDCLAQEHHLNQCWTMLQAEKQKQLQQRPQIVLGIAISALVGIRQTLAERNHHWIMQQFVQQEQRLAFQLSEIVAQRVAAEAKLARTQAELAILDKSI